MSEKTADSSDLNALASEVMDLWQEHLGAYANDPVAKAELIKMMEPQRKLFADWAAMMQNGGHGLNPFTTFATGAAKPSGFAGGASQPAAGAKSEAAAGAAPVTAASDDGTLRVAQLAHRVAELEKRLAELESGKSAAPKKTPRRTKPGQHGV